MEKVVYDHEKGKDYSAESGVAGGTLGAAGSIGAVAVAGKAGLGAIGITTGLKVIGSLVGGGMARGLCVVAAAPVAAGLLSYKGYKLWKRNRP